MAQSLTQAAQVHPVLTRALIYLWDHPAVTALCGMDHLAQRARCTAWAARQGWPIVAVLVDEAPVTADAPPLARQHLRAAVQERQCEVVVIPALVSLGPQLADVLALLDLLARQAVDLVSLHEAFDTTTAHGSFALLVVRALNQIAQLSAPALPQAAAVAAPIQPAAAAATSRADRQRPTLPFGYLQTASGIAVDPASAPIVRRIFLLRDAGATLPELVQVLRAQGGGRWNQRALAAVLAHEDAYRGGPHPSGGRWPTLLEARAP
jgi:Resolvase, N terminal domain